MQGWCSKVITLFYIRVGKRSDFPGSTLSGLQKSTFTNFPDYYQTFKLFQNFPSSIAIALPRLFRLCVGHSKGITSFTLDLAELRASFYGKLADHPLFQQKVNVYTEVVCVNSGIKSSDQKTIVAQLNEYTSKNLQNLNLREISPVISKFNPIQPEQPLGKYEGAGILFRPENKSCLTQ